MLLLFTQFLASAAQLYRVMTSQGEGSGATVRRIVGSFELRHLDPFLMLDHFFVQQPHGFPDHPHRGFETVTYMLNGTCKHEDFRGNAGEIGPGDVQWMTAGKGILHAEMPGTSSMEGFQLWINLPSTDKMCEPKYQEIKADKLKQVEEGGVKSILISDSVTLRTPVKYVDVHIRKGAKSIQQSKEGWNALVYVIQGKILVDEQVLKIGQAGLFNNTVELEATEAGRVIVLMGEPLEEPVAQYGPFVMNTYDQVDEAFKDYRNASNGFEGRLGWQSKIGKSVHLQS